MLGAATLSPVFGSPVFGSPVFGSPVFGSPVFGGVMDVVHEVTDRLDELSSHWWFIGVILVIAYLDSVVPVVPSETAVILGGVAAGQGNQQIALVIGAGALGAFLGDL